MKSYKPDNYNSLSPYLIVNNASKLIGELKHIFKGTIERRFDHESGRIAHLELKIDDSILMISDSTETYPAYKTILHMYVEDVHETYESALKHGCIEIEKPIQKPGDSDTRGSFYDCEGNYWSISTQNN